MGIDINIAESVAQVFTLPGISMSAITDETGKAIDLSMIDIQPGVEVELITISFDQKISQVGAETYLSPTSHVIHPVETVEITKD